MTLKPLFTSGMFPLLACPSIKRVIQVVSVSMGTIEETKRGPSLSLRTLRGPPAHLFDSPTTEKEGKQALRGRRKGRKRKRVHTLIHALPSSPPALVKTKRGENEKKGRGRTRTGKEEKRRRDVRRKRWKNNSPFIVGQLVIEGGCWYRGERLSGEQCVSECLCVCASSSTVSFSVLLETHNTVCIGGFSRHNYLCSCEVCFWWNLR